MTTFKKYYQMELALESGDKTQKIRIPHAKDDLTLEQVQKAVNSALERKLFMCDGIAAKELKKVYVTEVNELR